MPRQRYVPRQQLFQTPSSSKTVGRSFHRGTSIHSAQRNEVSTELHSISENVSESSIKNAIMAFTVIRGKLGCAVYDPNICKMMLLEDMPIQKTTNKIIERVVVQSGLESEGTELASNSYSDHSERTRDTEAFSMDTIMLLLKRYKPQLVLLNSRSDQEVKSSIERQASHIGFTLQIRPDDDFKVLFCKSVVQQLQIPVISLGYCATSTSQEDTQASLALLDSFPLSSASCAAIMSHIQRTNTFGRAEQNDESQNQESVILALEIFDLSNSMKIDPETAQAIGIFDRENHATVFSSRTKEGLSLFSLLSTALSRPAKSLLSQWLSFPSLNDDVLNARLDSVEFFVDNGNASFTTSLRKDVKGIKNIYTLSSNLISDKATLSTWKGINEFASKLVQVGMTCQTVALDGNTSIIDKIIKTFDHAQLTFVYESIGAIIDWDESSFTGRVAVRHGLDLELDEWRKALTNLPAILESFSTRLIESLDVDFAMEFNLAIEYFPQIGFLVSLNRKDGFAIDHTTVIAGQDLNWTYQYSSEVKAYFKNDPVKELDNDIGDLHTLIAGREIEIVQRLQAEVTCHIPSLIKCGDLLAELECLLAFANVAEKNRYVRPELLNQPIIDIEEGRHPLQELIVETFVPNHCTLVGGEGINSDNSIIDDRQNDYNSIMIITGANACGKSTYLRQIALIVVLAQIGSFVPARHACIGIVDKILTRIQIDESINSNRGSFQTDMEQVANALNKSTPRSLLLFDEMCKGTLQTDGVALFAGIIRHLLRRGDQCPRVLAATHFHEVFHENLLHPSMPITPAHMEIMLDKDSNASRSNDEDTETNIVFLYKLKPGLELVSHASQCAKLCGVPQAVIDRANHVAKLSKKHELKSLELNIIEDLAEAELMNDLKALQTSDDGIGHENTSQTYTFEQAEQVIRAFIAWNIDADKQTVAEQGEMAYLDPIVKLSRILNAPFTIKMKSTDPASMIDFKDHSIINTALPK